MHRLLVLPLLSLALLAGACATPEFRRIDVAGRDVYYAPKGDRLVFMLITPKRNAWDYGAEHRMLTGTHYTGTLVVGSGGERMTFDATNKEIRIGGNTYSLANGRVFVVGAPGSTQTVEQIALSPEQQARLIATSDMRVQRVFGG